VSVLAADDFNRADGVLGANWSAVTGTYVVSSGAAQITAVNSDAASRWNVLLPPADQWASVVVKTLVNSDAALGPMCRVSSITANRNFYLGKVGGPLGNCAIVQIIKQVASASTSLTTRTVAVVNVNDTIMLEAVGPVLTLKVNNVPILTVSDASHTSGYLGAYNVCSTGTPTNARIDDWLGGDFLNAAAGPGVIRNVFKRPADTAASASFVDGVTARKYKSIVG
jgi:hypothetical protein